MKAEVGRFSRALKPTPRSTASWPLTIPQAASATSAVDRLTNRLVARTRLLAARLLANAPVPRGHRLRSISSNLILCRFCSSTMRATSRARPKPALGRTDTDARAPTHSGGDERERRESRPPRLHKEGDSRREAHTLRVRGRHHYDPSRGVLGPQAHACTVTVGVKVVERSRFAAEMKQ